MAARAGVSKGGLLYHFPSKDALVKGMVSRIAAEVDERFKSELVGEPPGRGRYARMLVRLMMDEQGPLFPRIQRVAAPLLAAMASNPEMLAPIRKIFQEVHQGMLDDGLPPDCVWLILAALDGLKFWTIFRLHKPSKRDLEHLRHSLKQIIDHYPLTELKQASAPLTGRKRL